ncbi:nucleotidyltransferase domain-containing protein [Winogradskyella bathintestinalis]|uniref:Nucleotidyltransferase n=1 Tax=Winogradskyella bathintestinalis TaxID=3035208 RepID=A0ABT7ZWW4_9FLAO|nr:nucleotidyltransferase [Winogradskyella bathintestinalis]MDN3493503.1 nucleotidyltransferase [Winogradskyella bathintestinalis]
MEDQILHQISQYLDISPSDFKKAQERFNSSKDWLIGGTYESGYNPDVYLQGSFRLGTVVRPYKDDKDGEFDIDQVCELTKVNPPKYSKVLKNDIGNRLKENNDYKRMLDEEGRRCWTIKYASEEGRPGFHIDILPALPSNSDVAYKIDITNQENNIYTWSTCNPKGYYYWFKSMNVFSTEFMQSAKREIFESNRELFLTSDDVPKQLVRTSLQRAIQIMKRHRDVYFSKKDYRPISIIITTITAKVNQSNKILNTIQDFIHYVKKRHKFLVRYGYLDVDNILDYENKKWLIPNPADIAKFGEEPDNFADKWNNDENLSNAFFEWVYQLDRDLEGFKRSRLSDDLNLKIKTFGIGEKYSNIVIKNIQQRNIQTPSYFSGTEEHLLDLIHLGIEKKIDWETVKDFAQSYYDTAPDQNHKDIAVVNFYQIVRHRNITLSDKAEAQIKDVLNRNGDSTAFILCCNLLLGKANQLMIRNAFREFPYENILEWPIMRLYEKPLWLK